MNSMLKKFVVLIFFATFTATVGATTTNAADLTAEKQTIIQQTCVSAQTVLQKIQHNDAANRVNRGQVYETLGSRLMTPLNTRATSNGYDSSATFLIDTTKRYRQALNDFKDHYENYDNSVSAALRTKCKDKPSVFYGHIEDARRHRQSVASDITNLSSLIGEYRFNVGKLRSEVNNE